MLDAALGELEPPPNDFAAERVVVAALVYGRSRGLKRVRAEDFHDTWHRALVAAAALLHATGMKRTPARVCMAVEAMGLWDAADCAARIDEFLLPLPYRLDVSEEAERVRELGKRRRMLAWALELAAGLRSGLPAKDAYERIRRAAGG